MPVESGNQRPRALLDEARRRERWSEKADPAADAREGRGCDKRRPAREHPASAPSIAKIMARRAAVAACKAAEHDQREGEGRRRSARWSDGPRQNRFGFVWRHDRTDIEIDCTRMYLGGRAPKPRYRELLPDEASEPGPGPRRITSDQSTPRARLDLEPPVPRVEYFGRLGTKARASLSHDLSVVRRDGSRRRRSAARRKGARDLKSFSPRSPSATERTVRRCRSDRASEGRRSAVDTGAFPLQLRRKAAILGPQRRRIGRRFQK